MEKKNIKEDKISADHPEEPIRSGLMSSLLHNTRTLVIIAIAAFIALLGLVTYLVNTKTTSEPSKAAIVDPLTINWKNPYTKSRSAFLQLNYPKAVKMQVSRTLADLTKAPIIDYQTNYSFRLEIFSKSQLGNSPATSGDSPELTLNKTAYANFYDINGVKLNSIPISAIIQLLPTYKEIQFPEEGKSYNAVHYMCTLDTSGKTYTLKGSCQDAYTLLKQASADCLNRFGDAIDICRFDPNIYKLMCGVSTFFFDPKEECGTTPTPTLPPPTDNGTIVQGFIFNDLNKDGVNQPSDLDVNRVKMALIKRDSGGDEEIVLPFATSNEKNKRDYSFRKISPSLYTNTFRVDTKDDVENFELEQCSTIQSPAIPPADNRYFYCNKTLTDGSFKISLMKWKTGQSGYTEVTEGVFAVNGSTVNVDFPLISLVGVTPPPSRVGYRYINFQCIGDNTRTTVTLGSSSSCQVRRDLIKQAEEYCKASSGDIVICKNNNICICSDSPKSCDKDTTGIASRSFSGKCTL